MAKRLSVEEATRRVIDTINLLTYAEDVNIYSYMDRYASLRNLPEREKDDVYDDISFALFGH